MGVRIATIYNKLETTRAMVEVAREDLAARQENARLSEEQFKRGVLLTSQRDASHAQTMKAQAGFLEASLDYLLTRDELTRTLGTHRSVVVFQGTGRVEGLAQLLTLLF